MLPLNLVALMAFLLATARVSNESVNQTEAIITYSGLHPHPHSPLPPTPGQSGSGALARPLLCSPHSPASCGHRCGGQGSGEMRAPCLPGKLR